MENASPLSDDQQVNNQSKPMIQPGATIGMVGGGQLGRMFAMAASTMGFRVIILCDDPNSPAAQVAHDTVLGQLDDREAVDRFAKQCDVITLEFENIPAETIAQCSQYAPTYPSAQVLAIAQNRLIEKSTLRDAGLPVTPFLEVNDLASLERAGESLGWPIIVKTATSGYDGKGQSKVDSIAEADEIDWSACDLWIAEKCITFDLEVSVIVARTVTGNIAAFPVFENAHRNHILDVSVAPARIDASLADRAVQIAQSAAETLDLVGLLCVEFFVSGDAVMINEVAPRPHNSGHLTIEGCETSQFQQHVRAICNLPLGSTTLRSPVASMINLLGDLWQEDGTAPNWSAAFMDSSVALHLYGKSDAKHGRKMGHLTMTGQSHQDLIDRLQLARKRLEP
jgi:5-(carboxyamino)imidazole ribonucleotide synthase